MSTLSRNRVVEITHSFDKIRIVGHQALSLREVFQEIGPTQLVQSVVRTIQASVLQARKDVLGVASLVIR